MSLLWLGVTGLLDMVEQLGLRSEGQSTARTFELHVFVCSLLLGTFHALEFCLTNELWFVGFGF